MGGFKRYKRPNENCQQKSRSPFDSRKSIRISRCDRESVERKNATNQPDLYVVAERKNIETQTEEMTTIGTTSRGKRSRSASKRNSQNWKVAPIQHYNMSKTGLMLKYNTSSGNTALANGSDGRPQSAEA